MWFPLFTFFLNGETRASPCKQKKRRNTQLGVVFVLFNNVSPTDQSLMTQNPLTVFTLISLNISVKLCCNRKGADVARFDFALVKTARGRHGSGFVYLSRPFLSNAWKTIYKRSPQHYHCRKDMEKSTKTTNRRLQWWGPFVLIAGPLLCTKRFATMTVALRSCNSAVFARFVDNLRFTHNVPPWTGVLREIFSSAALTRGGGNCEHAQLLYSIPVLSKKLFAA